MTTIPIRSYYRCSHHLPYLYDGTNSAFFNGSFYFHRAGTPKIGKYELHSKRYNEVLIDENAAHKGSKVSDAIHCAQELAKLLSGNLRAKECHLIGQGSACSDCKLFSRQGTGSVPPFDALMSLLDCALFACVFNAFFLRFARCCDLSIPCYTNGGFWSKSKRPSPESVKPSFFKGCVWQHRTFV